MDARRRTALAVTAATLLPAAEETVIESWEDLLPDAAAWSNATFAQARLITRAILDGLVTVLRQGDLDERAWGQLRDAVRRHHRGDPQAIDDLLRAIRVTGVDWLTDELTSRFDLDHNDRWTLKLHAHDFFEQLIPHPPEIDADRLHALLADLERDGTDLR